VGDCTEIAGLSATTAEAMIGAMCGEPNAKTGAQKLAAATPFVAQVIQGSEIVVGKKSRTNRRSPTLALS
jgi:hypothetical protein